MEVCILNTNNKTIISYRLTGSAKHAIYCQTSTGEYISNFSTMKNTFGNLDRK